MIQVPCGIDEVGLGAVFGPLVVAGVANPSGWRHDGVKDSKKYHSDRKRYQVAQEIVANTLWVISVTRASALNIYGVHSCLRNAFVNVIKALSAEVLKQVDSPRLLIMADGNVLADEDRIITVSDRPVHITLRSEPKADAHYFEVSAASVVAKSYRDMLVRRMAKADPLYQRYQIDHNVGYGTPAHAEALLKYGLTPQHRVTFANSLMRSHKQRFKQTQSSMFEENVHE